MDPSKNIEFAWICHLSDGLIHIVSESIRAPQLAVVQVRSRSKSCSETIC